MNNYYPNSASCTDNESSNSAQGVGQAGAGSSSDSDSDDATSMSGPLKVMLRIKPKQETPPVENNTDLLREISKSLQLKPASASSSLNGSGFNLSKVGTGKKTKAYYYNYGTAAAANAITTNSFSNTTTPVNHVDMSLTEADAAGNSHNNNNMPRSYSVGTMPMSMALANAAIGTNNNNNNNNNNNASTATLAQNTNGNTGTSTMNNSLLDFGELNFSNISNNTTTNVNNNNNSTLQTSLSASKINNGNMMNTENNSLYNIDEDREVESSFQYSSAQNYMLKKSSTTTALPNVVSSGHNSNTSQHQPVMNTSNSSNNANFSRDMSIPNGNSCSSPSSGLSMSGRFTPACFPGRTTPDFRHSASLFEQQGTRASIISPLTVNGHGGVFGQSGAEIIPIAIAFNETVHAFFKMNEPSNKFKLKCFGCMKISFPYAVLKMLTVGAELPQLAFNLSQLQIVNQDLKLNQQLLAKSNVNGAVTTEDEAESANLNFEFIMPSLSSELRQQHANNKQAAFFNFELLKYEFKAGQQPPLTLNATWTKDTEAGTVELSLDYAVTFRKQLSQVNFMLIMPLNSNK
jgi:hypothetical protein